MQSKILKLFFLISILIELLATNKIIFAESSSLLTMSSFMGYGYLSQKKADIKVPFDPISFEWKEGTFTTQNLSTVRIFDVDSGLWYIMPSTSLTILNQSEVSKIREANLNYGELRIQAEGNLSEITAETIKFRDKMIIKTPELKITVPRGGDVLISRLKDKKGNFYSKVIVLGGIVYLNKTSKTKKDNLLSPISLKPGIEFVMNYDGTVQPLIHPSANYVDYFYAFTSLPNEFLGILTEDVDFNNINEVMSNIKTLAENEEYFEIQSTLLPYEKYSNNDVRIPYYLGVAKKGLYQDGEAKSYFSKALQVDRKFALAHWQLAFYLLDEKKYAEAHNEFEMAKDYADDEEKIHHEYEYYIGVTEYFQKNLIGAKGHFKIAVVDQVLPGPLRQSAGDFLSKIPIDKPWTVVVPVGIQYDSNMLSIAHNQSLPTDYSTKSGWKSIAGLMFNYDSIKATENDGWHFGLASKIFYIKNYPSSFKSLDALVLEGTINTTHRYSLLGEKTSKLENKSDKSDKPEEKNLKKEEYKLYATLGRINVGYKGYTNYVLFGLNYNTLELNIGYNFDISSPPDGYSKTAIVANQYYQIDIGTYGIFTYNILLQSQEQYMMKKNINVGNTFEPVVTPEAVYSISNSANVKISHAFDFTYTFASPVQSDYKFLPTVAYNYIFNTWLMGSFSVSYEYHLKYPLKEVVSKPGMSLMFIGIF